MNLNQLKQYKTSDRIYILGSGRSILDISKEEWDEIKKYDSIGFNHWYVHEHKPTFYDLSYLANDYFKSEEDDMFYQAVKNCPDSAFILNHELDAKHKSLFQDKIYTLTYINHFDFFQGDWNVLENTNDDEIGKIAKYWTLDFFTYFNHPHGELLPNKNFIFKSRGQLFATIQIAISLGYQDIRLLGIDLNDEGKFQDTYPSAPDSSKSIGYGGENFQPRINVANNVKIPNGIHNTCQGTKDKDYLGIHKLIDIFNRKCLKRIGVSLTVCNSNSLLTKTGIKYQPIIGKLIMNKITFCIPSKSNLRYLKTCIPSIRENAYRDDHEIIIFVDSDEDGTIEWLKQVKDQYNLTYYVNPNLGESLFGIGKAYDYCIEQSTTDIFMIFHADMMLGKHADFKAYQQLKEKTVVCSTRVEPPIHPNAGEKILLDFGMWPEEFKKEEFNQYVEEHLDDLKITEGIFAPWMMNKKEYLSILGGHDPQLHSCREDSDLFNRMLLAGFNFIQPWNSLVYHLTGRGAGSFDGDPERHRKWQEDMHNSTLAFIKKWGTNVQHTPLMKPIVSPVYKKSLKINNSNPNIGNLENTLNTWFNDGQDIIVEVDANNFTSQDFQVIQQLNNIIKDSGEIGTFEIGNLKITINNLTEYQDNLIYL